MIFFFSKSYSKILTYFLKSCKRGQGSLVPPSLTPYLLRLVHYKNNVIIGIKYIWVLLFLLDFTRCTDPRDAFAIFRECYSICVLTNVSSLDLLYFIFYPMQWKFG